MIKHVIGNNVLLHFQKTSDKMMVNGVEMYMDDSFNEDTLTNQDAVIAATPRKLTGFFKDFNLDIKIGDKVYVHHFATRKEHKLEVEGVKLTQLAYHQLYCKVVDGKISMIGDHILVEPMMESDEDCMSGLLWLRDPERISKLGILRYLNKFTKELGYKEGDVIAFPDYGEYKLNVEGVEYFRMRNEDIRGKYKS